MFKLTTPVLFFFLCYTSIVNGQNYSLNFDGADDYVLFPECPGMTASGFTIEGWFKCQASNNPQVILMSFRNLPDKNANITLEVRPEGILRFNYRSDAIVLGGEDLSSTSLVSNNQWHHFAAVKEGTDHLWLYIDGFPEVVTCGFYDKITVTPVFELGRNRYDQAANFRYFRGNLDDIKIWNRAKNCREVFNDYKTESAGSEPGLYGNYKFDINLDTIYDCSPNNKHGKRFGVNGQNNLPKFSNDIPSLNDVMCDFQLVGTEEELSISKQEEWFIISPNPVLNYLEISALDAKDIRGQIYNSSGQLVQEIENLEKDTKIDISGLPGGSYLIKLGNSDMSKTVRFIKI